MCNVNGIIRFAQLRMKEAVTGRCSVKKVFLEISQDSHENTCVRAFFFLLKLHCGKSVQIRIFFWSVFFCIQSDTGKYRPEKTQYLDTFHTVFQASVLRLYQKRDSNTGVFLWVLWNILRMPFSIGHLLWLLLVWTCPCL